MNGTGGGVDPRGKHGRRNGPPESKARPTLGSRSVGGTRYLFYEG